jgi:hypothetical protein
MKNTRKSQLEKFNAKFGKNAADQAVEAKQVEKKIAAEMEQKKDMYNAIGILERSITMLTNQVTKLRDENTMLAGVREENQMLKQKIDNLGGKVDEMHKVLLGMSYLSTEEGAQRTVNNYKSMLHRWRAEQIKNFGTFMDPPVEMMALMGYATMNDEETIEEEQEVVVAAAPVQKEKKEKVEAPVTPKSKPGRPPGRVSLAKKLIAEHTLDSGRYSWKAGGIELVFAIFTLAEHDQESLSSSSKNVDVRKAYQQVAYNKEQYGVAGWADLIVKYEEHKKSKQTKGAK